jgi:predicted nucleic acid-binding protein
MAGERYLVGPEYLLLLTGEHSEHPVFRWLHGRIYYICAATMAAAAVAVRDSNAIASESKEIHLDNLSAIANGLERTGRLVTADSAAILKWGELASEAAEYELDALDAHFLAVAIEGEYTLVSPHSAIFDTLVIPWIDPASMADETAD